MAQQLANWARETEREGNRAGEETGADWSAPLSSERARERGHAGGRATADRRGPPVKRRGRAGARLAGPS
jgi:hypothetical protein